jgi:hypothetical protein
MCYFHPLSDGASQWIQHDAEQLDRHLPGFAWFGSDANDRTGLGTQCEFSLVNLIPFAMV